ncbi:MAG: nitroreductase family protein [candidate division Zixibacteria bacterium]|nr:nitroreductase family protein [candidate division Zixibacteria bacterium]
MNSLFKRRSIRHYTKEPIKPESIELLLKAAMAAPSAGNQQPWHFIVIQDRRILEEIPNLHPYAQMVMEAPLAILVCGDISSEKHPGFWVQDCSAATENILIEACELGLGAVWVGVYPNEQRVAALSKLVGLPEKIIPFSLVPIGYPAEHKPPSNRYDMAKIHYNRW